MAGELTIFGDVTVGGCVPSVAAPIVAALAELQAKLAGALALQAKLGLHPPSLQANLNACGALLTALQAAIAIGMPGVDFQLAAVATLIAQLQAKIAALIGLPFGVAGVLAAEYVGDTAAFGSTVTSAMGHGILGGSQYDQMFALVFAARAAASINAMKGVFLHT